MVTRVLIEQFYENLEEATIGHWIKAEGDPVQTGEPLVEIITDKVTFEYESPGSGLLRSILAPEKSVLPVGYVIGLLGEETDELPDLTAHNSASAERRQRDLEGDLSKPPAEAKASPGSGQGISLRDRGKVRATPAARRAAREQNVDLSVVAETLAGGLVQEEDVLKWVEDHR